MSNGNGPCLRILDCRVVLQKARVMRGLFSLDYSSVDSTSFLSASQKSKSPPPPPLLATVCTPPSAASPPERRKLQAPPPLLSSSLSLVAMVHVNKPLVIGAVSALAAAILFFALRSSGKKVRVSLSHTHSHCELVSSLRSCGACGGFLSVSTALNRESAAKATQTTTCARSRTSTRSSSSVSSRPSARRWAKLWCVAVAIY